MEVKLNNGFGFIIDTNEYSGNFERELCAHITGHIGECGVGDEFIDDEIDGLFENVIGVDDDGCNRPCKIFRNKEDTSYKSVIIYFSSEPTKEQISIMKERSYTFNETNNKLNKDKSYHRDSKILILGFRLLEVKQIITNIEI